MNCLSAAVHSTDPHPQPIHLTYQPLNLLALMVSKNGYLKYAPCDLLPNLKS